MVMKNTSIEYHLFTCLFNEKTIRILIKYRLWFYSCQIFFSFFFAAIKKIVDTIFVEVVFFCKCMCYFQIADTCIRCMILYLPKFQGSFSIRKSKYTMIKIGIVIGA
jgi:hypothetical protein